MVCAYKSIHIKLKSAQALSIEKQKEYVQETDHGLETPYTQERIDLYYSSLRILIIYFVFPRKATPKSY